MEDKYAAIKGRNFSGTTVLKGTSLQLQLTEFRKQAFFSAKIDRHEFQKIFQKFPFLMKTQEVFEELITNKKLQISDNNMLVIPIELAYKDKKVEAFLRVPLTESKIKNQQEKCNKLFECLEKMAKQKAQIDKVTRKKMIYFKGDECNRNYKEFQVSDNQCIIKMIGKENKHLTFSHYESLPKNDVFYFKVKIVHTTNKIVLLGICGKDIREAPNPYFNNLFMGFYLYNGELYANGKAKQTEAKFTISEGVSVVMVVIDTRKNEIGWFLDNKRLYQTSISPHLLNTEIFPMINLYNEGDTIEILQQ